MSASFTAVLTKGANGTGSSITVTGTGLTAGTYTISVLKSGTVISPQGFTVSVGQTTGSTPFLNLTDGTYTIYAVKQGSMTQLSVDGVTSGSIRIIDTTAPDVPVLLPLDHYETTPLEESKDITVTAESGSTINLYVDSYSSGIWSSDIVVIATIATGSSQTISVSPLLVSTLYRFSATATDAAGNVSARSALYTVPAPGAPNITQVTPSPGSIAITYTAGASDIDVTGHKAYVYSDEDFVNVISTINGVSVGPSTATLDVSTADLTDNVTYYLSLTSVNASGESIKSSSIPFVYDAPVSSGPTPSLARPTPTVAGDNVTMSSSLEDAGTATVASWVWQKSVDNSNWEDLTVGDSPDANGAYTLTTAKPTSGILYYRASATLSDATVVYSVPCAVEQLATPANHSFTPGHSKITVSWTTVSGVIYKIEKKIESGSYETVPDTITGSTYDVEGVNGTTYYVRISAISATPPSGFDAATYIYSASDTVESEAVTPQAPAAPALSGITRVRTPAGITPTTITSRIEGLNSTGAPVSAPATGVTTEVWSVETAGNGAKSKGPTQYVSINIGTYSVNADVGETLISDLTPGTEYWVISAYDGSTNAVAVTTSKYTASAVQNNDSTTSDMLVVNMTPAAGAPFSGVSFTLYIVPAATPNDVGTPVYSSTNNNSMWNADTNTFTFTGLPPRDADQYRLVFNATNYNELIKNDLNVAAPSPPTGPGAEVGTAPVIATPASSSLTVTAPATSVTTMTATGGSIMWSVEGEHASLFNIDTSGFLTFKNNSSVSTYNVTVKAANTAGFDTEALTVTVNAAQSGPTVSPRSTIVLVGTTHVSDIELLSDGETATWAINGGADSLLFEIANVATDSKSVTLQFITAPTAARTEPYYVNVLQTSTSGGGNVQINYTINVTGNSNPPPAQTKPLAKPILSNITQVQGQGQNQDVVNYADVTGDSVTLQWSLVTTDSTTALLDNGTAVTYEIRYAEVVEGTPITFPSGAQITSTSAFASIQSLIAGKVYAFQVRAVTTSSAYTLANSDTVIAYPLNDASAVTLVSDNAGTVDASWAPVSNVDGYIVLFGKETWTQAEIVEMIPNKAALSVMYGALQAATAPINLGLSTPSLNGNFLWKPTPKTAGSVNLTKDYLTAASIVSNDTLHVIVVPVFNNDTMITPDYVMKDKAGAASARKLTKPTVAGISTLTASSTDSANGTFTWSNGSSGNSITPTVSDTYSVKLVPSNTNAYIVSESSIGTTVTVTPADITAPVIGGLASYSVLENTTNAVASFEASETITSWTLGGTDALLFSITGGVLRFNSPPDFEATRSNVYTVIVQATDAANNTGSKTVTVTVTDVNETVVVGGGPSNNAICFLADAPVLTPSGYRAISSIKEGDMVRTAGGLNVAVKRVFRKEYVAGASVNPFVIPKGSFGALRALPISPNHEVMTARGMVQAKELGLPRMKMAGSFTYYNLELEDWVRDNLVVAGVECESLAPAARVSMTKAEFGKFVKARYGPAAAARLRTVCFEEKDGSVSMPAFI